MGPQFWAVCHLYFNSSFTPLSPLFNHSYPSFTPLSPPFHLSFTPLSPLFYPFFTALSPVPFHQCSFTSALLPLFQHSFTTLSALFYHSFTTLSPLFNPSFTPLSLLFHNSFTTLSPLFHPPFTPLSPLFHHSFTTLLLYNPIIFRWCDMFPLLLLFLLAGLADGVTQTCRLEQLSFASASSTFTDCLGKNTKPVTICVACAVQVSHTSRAPENRG